MSSENVLKNCDTKMKKAFEIFVQDLSSLRTGRANASMLDIIKVDVYGQKMSINQLATISTPESRTINVQVWDMNNVTAIDSAIKKSSLGINPQIDGQLIRIPVPALTEERRVELKKIMGGLAEKAKISIRNIRREANDLLKKDLKEKKIGTDECDNFEKKIQNSTDKQILELEKKLDDKEKEIMKI
jgi:ribosome recycling factor